MMKASILFTLLIGACFAGRTQVGNSVEMRFSSLVKTNKIVEIKVHVYPNGTAWISSDSNGMSRYMTFNSESFMSGDSLYFVPTFTVNTKGWNKLHSMERNEYYDH